MFTLGTKLEFKMLKQHYVRQLSKNKEFSTWTTQQNIQNITAITKKLETNNWVLLSTVIVKISS